ncbi:hypothetical protein CC80DRAFT_531482 [Byssothecium circinans]|uniref:Uncharacterized protein n=1 Tax=Byssothecium circinans TaxID=147558 RepID=A0A6A5UKM2_9PLEO|nr:hypothetical protein CC80DRAFT_531482 [Byssothecium circinans]
MIQQVGSRLAIVAVLLALQVLIFVLELLIFVASINARKWYMPLRQWFGPVGIALLGLVLVSVAFTNKNAELQSTGNQCSTGVDADVAGDGVRIAVWAQVSVLILISLLGSFHSNATGAKEIGAGLVLTHLSLAIALVVQVSRRTLTLADAATGAMILDAQNIALSIQFSAKETLAARWQVSIAIMVQLFGLAVLPVLVSKLGDGSFATDDCRRLTVFWWAWLGNCTTCSRETVVFWTYFTCRCVGFCQTTFHSLYNTQSFHLAELERPGDNANKEQNRGGTLDGITYPYISRHGHGPARYGEYPATVSLMYTLYGLLALTSLTAVESAIRGLNLRPTSAVGSIGQIIALVIAGATIARAAWLFGNLFVRESDSKFLGFIQPFKLGQSNFRSYGTYVPVPKFEYTPDFLPLGSILKSPMDPSSRFRSHIPPQEEFHPVQQTNFTYESTKPIRAGSKFLMVTFESTIPETIMLSTLRLDTLFFTPTMEYLQRSLQQTEVAEYLKQSRGKKVYVVTGVKIARNPILSQTQGHDTQISATADIEAPNFPIAAGAQVSIGGGRQHSVRMESVDILFAYRLHAVSLSRRKSAVKETVYTQGARF